MCVCFIALGEAEALGRTRGRGGRRVMGMKERKKEKIRKEIVRTYILRPGKHLVIDTSDTRI